MMNRSDKNSFLVARFSDTSIYKVTLEILKNIIAHNLVNVGDLDLTEAKKLVANSSDHGLITYAHTLPINEIQEELKPIHIGYLPNIPMHEWIGAEKLIMTESELDRFLVTKAKVG